MTDDAEQVWLVEREYSDKGLVTLVYATPDGERAMRSNRSINMLTRQGVTAATEADPGKLTAIEDDDLRERYAREAQRMQSKHDPDDEV
ncbi:MAG: hypothetical protein ABEJ31_09910 [Haloarculaceae archaeon]